MYTMENTNVPAFLNKLWVLVEDPNTDDLIFWNETGSSFHICDTARFSKEILPLYFKHSNIASFVRQLNMYGFRKVVDIHQGGLRSERDVMEFSHQFFQRDHEYLLEFIKRKISHNHVKSDPLNNESSIGLKEVVLDVDKVKTTQESMNLALNLMKRENEVLWREVATLQQKHQKQQQIVNKLIQFLLSFVNTNKIQSTTFKRKLPLMIKDTSSHSPRKVIKKSVPVNPNLGNNTSDAQISDLIYTTSSVETTEKTTELADKVITFQNDDLQDLINNINNPRNEPCKDDVELPSTMALKNDNSTFIMPDFCLDSSLLAPQHSAILSEQGDCAMTDDLIATDNMVGPENSTVATLGDVSETIEIDELFLDSLKELLSNGQYKIDQKAVLSMFNPDPQPGLTSSDDYSKMFNPDPQPGLTSSDDYIKTEVVVPQDEFDMLLNAEKSVEIIEAKTCKNQYEIPLESLIEKDDSDVMLLEETNENQIPFLSEIVRSQPYLNQEPLTLELETHFKPLSPDRSDLFDTSDNPLIDNAYLDLYSNSLHLSGTMADIDNDVL